MIDLENVRRYRPGTIIFVPGIKLTPAAVMMLVHRGRDTVLFIVRSASVRKHRGQVGLPGGRVEGSETPIEAAYRETREEIGLGRGVIEVVGEIDRLQTNTGYLVHSFVCLWEEDGPLVPDEREVSDIFEVPYEFLLDPENIRLEIWRRYCITKEMYFWEYEGRTIWGVTGDILASLYRVMRGENLADVLSPSPSRMREFIGSRALGFSRSK